MDTTIQLPPELRQQLEALAERTGRTEAEIIVEAVETYLRAERRPRLRSLGAFQDDEVHAANLDEWLKANWRPEDDWR